MSEIVEEIYNQLNIQIQLLEERNEKLKKRNQDLEKRNKLLEIDKYTYYHNLYSNEFMIGIMANYMTGPQFGFPCPDDKLIKAVKDSFKTGSYSTHKNSYQKEVVGLLCKYFDRKKDVKNCLGYTLLNDYFLQSDLSSKLNAVYFVEILEECLDKITKSMEEEDIEGSYQIHFRS